MFPDGFAARPVVATTPLVDPLRPETSAIIITRSLADRLVANVTVHAPDVAIRPWMTWQRNKAVACVASVVAIAVYGVLRVSVALSVAVVALPPNAIPRTMIRLPAVTFDPNATASDVPAVALNVPVF
jgi:hypothetical protein